jgi:hypothetical protein
MYTGEFTRQRILMDFSDIAERICDTGLNVEVD